MGTPRHPHETYFDSMQLALFDCVIVFLDRRRLREMEVQLLRRALTMQLFVAVVYGKMDEALEDAEDELRRGPPSVDAGKSDEGIIEALRCKLVAELEKAMHPVAVPHVFLISGDKWLQGTRDHDEERLEKFIIRAALRKVHHDVGDDGLDKLFECVRRMREDHP